MEEIDEATDEHGVVDYINGESVISKKQAKDIIRNHMNDGWIPVEKQLPDVTEGTEDPDCPEFNVMIKGESKSTTLKYSWDGTWFDDNGYLYDVIAWQPLPEPYRPEEKNMKYIASWSGGKDSTASIILAHEHNEPLDLIIFSEVMFDENISGELPEHIDFIKNRAIPVFKSWGYEVKILRSDKTYMDCFSQKLSERSSHKELVGMKWGFPRVGQCVINSQCKIKQMKQFLKNLEFEFTQYIGIAVDEPARMERIVNSGNKVSLLEKYGYTEQMAFDLCKKYDLLSPIYEFTNRGGCWFCPNMRYAQLKHLRTNHPDLWKKLLELENEPDLIGNMWNTLTKTRIHDWEERFCWEDRQMSIFDYLERSGRE